MLKYFVSMSEIILPPSETALYLLYLTDNDTMGSNGTRVTTRHYSRA